MTTKLQRQVEIKIIHVYDTLLCSYRARRKNFNADFVDAVMTVGRALSLPPTATVGDVLERVDHRTIAQGHSNAVNDYCKHRIPVVRGFDAGILQDRASGIYYVGINSIFFHRHQDAVIFRMMWDGGDE